MLCFTVSLWGGILMLARRLQLRLRANERIELHLRALESNRPPPPWPRHDAPQNSPSPPKSDQGGGRTINPTGVGLLVIIVMGSQILSGEFWRPVLTFLFLFWGVPLVEKFIVRRFYEDRFLRAGAFLFIVGGVLGALTV